MRLRLSDRGPVLNRISGHTLRFIEKPKNVDTLIVLPELDAPGDELDEEDLDAVAGGTACFENSTSW